MPVRKKRGSSRNNSSISLAHYNAHLEHVNNTLVDNFTGMQKVLVNIAVKLDSLTGQISRLLQLFEVSAKSFAEKQSHGGTDIQKDAEFLQKLNTLMDQNKTIAKGLTLMGENIRERVYGTDDNRPVNMPGIANIPRPVSRRLNPVANSGEGFEKSFGDSNKSSDIA